MSRPRKNVKRIDPRYFLDETTHRDQLDEALPPASRYSSHPGREARPGQTMPTSMAQRAGVSLREDPDPLLLTPVVQEDCDAAEKILDGPFLDIWAANPASAAAWSDLDDWARNHCKYVSKK